MIETATLPPRVARRSERLLPALASASALAALAVLLALFAPVARDAAAALWRGEGLLDLGLWSSPIGVAHSFCLIGCADIQTASLAWLLLTAALTTLVVIAAAIAVAAPFGLSVAAAMRSRDSRVRWTAGAIATLFANIPPLLMLLIAYRAALSSLPAQREEPWALGPIAATMRGVYTPRPDGEAGGAIILIVVLALAMLAALGGATLGRRRSRLAEPKPPARDRGFAPITSRRILQAAGATLAATALALLLWPDARALVGGWAADWAGDWAFPQASRFGPRGGAHIRIEYVVLVGVLAIVGAARMADAARSVVGPPEPRAVALTRGFWRGVRSIVMNAPLGLALGVMGLAATSQIAATVTGRLLELTLLLAAALALLNICVGRAPTTAPEPRLVRARGRGRRRRGGLRGWLRRMRGAIRRLGGLRAATASTVAAAYRLLSEGAAAPIAASAMLVVVGLNYELLGAALWFVTTDSSGLGPGDSGACGAAGACYSFLAAKWDALLWGQLAAVEERLLVVGAILCGVLAFGALIGVRDRRRGAGLIVAATAAQLGALAALAGGMVGAQASGLIGGLALTLLLLVMAAPWAALLGLAAAAAPLSAQRAFRALATIVSALGHVPPLAMLLVLVALRAALPPDAAPPREILVGLGWLLIGAAIAQREAAPYVRFAHTRRAASWDVVRFAAPALLETARRLLLLSPIAALVGVFGLTGMVTVATTDIAAGGAGGLTVMAAAATILWALAAALDLTRRVAFPYEMR